MSSIILTTKEELIEIVQNAIQTVMANQQPEKEDNPDKMMTVEELIDYLPGNPARQTVYGWVNYRKIPFEKFGKNLYFRKSDIDRWLDNGRKVNFFEK